MITFIQEHSWRWKLKRQHNVLSCKYLFIAISILYLIYQDEILNADGIMRRIHCAVKLKDKEPFCSSFRPQVVFGYIHMLLNFAETGWWGILW